MDREDNFYLFLDFDGVLHPFDHRYGFFSHMPLFEDTIKDLPIQIVVSSAWRLHHTMPVLKSLFSKHIADKIIGITPDLDNKKKPYIREVEIKHWLKKHAKNSQQWIALDDSPELFSPTCSELILVDPDIGFNEITKSQLLKKFL